MFVIVIDMIVLRQIVTDGAAQGRSSGVGSVGGVAGLERIDRAFPDVPRSHEVGFADAERNDVAAPGHQIEKFTDAAFGQIPDGGYHERFRGKLGAVHNYHPFPAVGRIPCIS
ncbi:hypothetical protein SDC9_130788 [bioreactor metagenome]|uniref:Uncharacterized protein n=1 Tax=bioreactor metagenome TaxID=1076179 RepID=A0A645D3E4_9ZZZZ